MKPIPVAAGSSLGYNPGMGWNVYGHEWASEMLKEHIARSAVRHAYLFTGPPGVGRRTLALRFAQALNCTEPPEPGQPCGKCRTCLQIERMQQADLSIVRAEQEGVSLKVEQMRELQSMLSLSPYESRYRIALLLRFHEATVNAQNAFLKTLEEPAPRVVLLLTADSSESLLPTIVSRCEVLRLRPMQLDRLMKILEEKHNLTPGDAQRLAHLSGGRMGYAMHLQSDPGVLQKENEKIEDCLSLLHATYRDRISYGERFKSRDSRVKAYETLRVWLFLWRDMLLKASGSKVPLVYLDWQEQISSIASRLSSETIRPRISDLEEALVQLDTTNVNASLLMEVVLLDWPKLTP
jgi:DNA polymerase-3 subunit delta'